MTTDQIVTAATDELQKRRLVIQTLMQNGKGNKAIHDEFWLIVAEQQLRSEQKASQVG